MTMLDTTAASLGADARAFVLLKPRRWAPSVIDLRTFCTANVIRIIWIMEPLQWLTRTHS